MDKENLKQFLHDFFEYKEATDNARPLWISKQFGNYVNGEWIVGENDL